MTPSTPAQSTRRSVVRIAPRVPALRRTLSVAVVFLTVGAVVFAVGLDAVVIDPTVPWSASTRRWHVTVL